MRPLYVATTILFSGKLFLPGLSRYSKPGCTLSIPTTCRKRHGFRIANLHTFAVGLPSSLCCRRKVVSQKMVRQIHVCALRTKTSKSFVRL